MKSYCGPSVGVLSYPPGTLALPRLSDGHTISWDRFHEIAIKAESEQAPATSDNVHDLERASVDPGQNIRTLDQWQKFLRLDKSSEEVPCGIFFLPEDWDSSERELLYLFENTWKYKVPISKCGNCYCVKVLGGFILETRNGHIACELAYDRKKDRAIIIDRCYQIPEAIVKTHSLILPYIANINHILDRDEFYTFASNACNMSFNVKLMSYFDNCGPSIITMDIDAGELVSIARFAIMSTDLAKGDKELLRARFGAVLSASLDGREPKINIFASFQNATTILIEDLPKRCDLIFKYLLQRASPRGFGVGASMEPRNIVRLFPALRLTRASILLNMSVQYNPSAALRASERIMTAEALKELFDKIGIAGAISEL